MTTTHHTDITILGAGPVGLFAVFQCGMLGMKCHVVDTLPHIGGQPSALYPDKPIYDIPSQPKITGQDLITQLTMQAAPFAPVYHLGQQIVAIESLAVAPAAAAATTAISTSQSQSPATGANLPSVALWKIITSTGTIIHSKAIFIAGGAGSFVPNRPPLDNIEQFEGTSVFYSVPRAADLAGRHIVIAGGGDSAVDWAIALVDIAASIHVVHRRDDFRAAPESVARLHQMAKDNRLNLVIPYQLSALKGLEKKLEEIHVKTLKGQDKIIKADTLLSFFGLATSLGPIADWGLDIARHQIVVDPATCQTNLAGIYCVGDMAAYAGKLKLILQGFSEVAMAAHSAYGYVYPGKLLQHTHSTDKGLPG